MVEKKGEEKKGEKKKNKAGYTAIPSRTVGQEQSCEKRSEFKNVTDGRTDRQGKV